MKINFIDNNSNPTNVIIKAKLCATLQELIDTNIISLNVVR